MSTLEMARISLIILAWILILGGAFLGVVRKTDIITPEGKLLQRIWFVLAGIAVLLTMPR